MKRQATAEQKAKAAERKARFAALVKKVAEMSDEQRAQMAAQMGVVVNCEGRPLSPRNTMLAAMQRGNVTIVGGFRQWLDKGRCVRKGEHGLQILVPCNPKKDENKQEGEISTKDRVFFVSGTVFDISQTDAIEGQVCAEMHGKVVVIDNEAGTITQAPRLMNGETQGDLITSTQREDFALVPESAIDGAAITAAATERENNERATLAQNLTFELVS